MESDKRVETLEEELKLIKGELKQTLTGVRDYLLNMELPSSEFSTILAALGSDGSGTQKVTIEGNIANSKAEEEPGDLAEDLEEVTEEELEDPEDELPLNDDILSPDEFPEEDEGHADSSSSRHDTPTDEEISEDDAYSDLDESDDSDDFMEANDIDDTSDPGEIEEPAGHEEQEEYIPPKAGRTEAALEEDPLMGYDNSTGEPQPSTPKVNLLANLINWVAKAKKEIGYEQLAIFLEVYGVSGHLSPELKEVILQLAQITTEQAEEVNITEVWSQSILSLHGILTGGDAPLYPFKSSIMGDDSEMMSAEEEIIEVDKPKDEPVKLKLVLPDSNGNSKEFCLNLTPDIDGDEA